MRRELMICDRCSKPASELIELSHNNNDRASELCRRCVMVRINEIPGLVAVRLEFAQPVAAPVRLRARGRG